MLDEKTIEELHSYYDRLPGGICLVKADDSEEILLANAELLNYYQCCELAGVQGADRRDVPGHGGSIRLYSAERYRKSEGAAGGKLCLLPVPVQDERRPFQ